MAQKKPNRDHSIEQAQAALALRQHDYPSDEKSIIQSPDKLSSVTVGVYAADQPVHPTHDIYGNVWIYPTPEEISGPDSLRRVVDKMCVPVLLVRCVFHTS